MASKRRRVGVDIGSTAVRVAEVSGILPTGHIMVSRLGSAPLPPGAVSAGEIRNPVAVASALTQALSVAGVPNHGFIIGLSGPATGVTRTNQPAGLTPAERISAAKHSHLALPAGLDATKSQLAVSVTRTKITGEQQAVSECVFASADSESVDRIVKVCQLAKLTPRAIDLSGAGITRAYTRVPEDDQSSMVIIDMGHTSITVIGRHGPSLVHLETIKSLSGQFFTQALQRSLGGSFQEAEERKHHLRLIDVANEWAESSYSDRYGTGEVPVAARQAAEDLTNTDLSDAVNQAVVQINNSVNTAIGSMPSGMIQGLLLTGGSARMQGMADRIKDTLGYPTTVGTPWAKIEAHKRNLDYFIDRRAVTDNERPEVLGDFATAIGLAQWRES